MRAQRLSKRRGRPPGPPAPEQSRRRVERSVQGETLETILRLVESELSFTETVRYDVVLERLVASYDSGKSADASQRS